MKKLNIEFLEEYKSVDRFIKEAFGTQNGVTAYINEMDEQAEAGRKKVPNWHADYKALKHDRWIRNQLAHEVDITSDICTKEDYDWLCDFHKRLLKAKDPLAMLYSKGKKTGKNNGSSGSTSAVRLLFFVILLIILIFVLKIIF